MLFIAAAQQMEYPADLILMVWKEFSFQPPSVKLPETIAGRILHIKHPYFTIVPFFAVPVRWSCQFAVLQNAAEVLEIKCSTRYIYL